MRVPSKRRYSASARGLRLGLSNVVPRVTTTLPSSRERNSRSSGTGRGVVVTTMCGSPIRTAGSSVSVHVSVRNRHAASSSHQTPEKFGPQDALRALGGVGADQPAVREFDLAGAATVRLRPSVQSEGAQESAFPSMHVARTSGSDRPITAYSPTVRVACSASHRDPTHVLPNPRPASSSHSHQSPSGGCWSALASSRHSPPAVRTAKMSAAARNSSGAVRVSGIP